MKDIVKYIFIGKQKKSYSLNLGKNQREAVASVLNIPYLRSLG
jgi:hypothetical protein